MRDHGVPELQDVVKQGRASVSAAAAVAELPPEGRRVAAAGGTQHFAAAAKKARAPKNDATAEVRERSGSGGLS